MFSYRGVAIHNSSTSAAQLHNTSADVAQHKPKLACIGRKINKSLEDRIICQQEFV